MNDVLFHRSFADSVEGIFPDLLGSIATLRRNLDLNLTEGEVAISRCIALSIDAQGIIKVFYKNLYVGWIAPDNDIVHVKRGDLAWVVSHYLSHVLGWKVD